MSSQNVSIHDNSESESGNFQLLMNSAEPLLREGGLTEQPSEPNSAQPAERSAVGDLRAKGNAILNGLNGLLTRLKSIDMPKLSDTRQKDLRDLKEKIIKKISEINIDRLKSFGVATSNMLQRFKLANSRTSVKNYSKNLIEFLDYTDFQISNYLVNDNNCKVFINCANAIRLKNILKLRDIFKILNRLKISKVYVSVGFMFEGYISNINLNGDFEIIKNPRFGNSGVKYNSPDNQTLNLYKNICIKTDSDFEYCKSNFLMHEQKIIDEYYYMPISDENENKSIQTVNKDYCKILITCDNLSKLVNTIHVPIVAPIEIRVRTLSTKNVRAHIISLEPETYSFTIKYFDNLSKLYSQGTKFSFDKLCVTDEGYNNYAMCISRPQ